MGTGLEAAAIQRIRTEPEDGRVLRKVKFGRKGGPMIAHQAVITYAADGTPQVTLDSTRPLPTQVLADLKAHPGGPFQMRFTEPSDTTIKLAFLAWGFLALFATYGYRYVLSPASRLVRRAIVERTETFGSAYWLRFGPFSSRLDTYSFAYVLRDSPRNALLGVGVRFGSVLVCVPPASDPEGLRLEEFGRESAPSGAADVRLQLYQETDAENASRVFVGELSGTRLFGTSEDSELIVAASGAECLSTLSQPSRPAAHRRSRRSREAIRDDWFDDAFDIPGVVAPDDWLATILDDLERRQDGPDLVTLRRIRQLSSQLGQESVIDAMAALLDTHLASHVRDSHRIFVDLELADDIDEVTESDALTRARAVLSAAGHPNAALSFSSVALGPDPRIASHALIAVDNGHEMIVGRFYTAHTLMLAAEVSLSGWRDVSVAQV